MRQLFFVFLRYGGMTLLTCPLLSTMQRGEESSALSNECYFSFSLKVTFSYNLLTFSKLIHLFPLSAL
jgi:hypothetical protein